MNNTQTRTFTTVTPISTEEHQSEVNSTTTFTDLLTAYQTTIEKPPIPFIPNESEPFDPFTSLTTATSSPLSALQPVSWLWHQRIPSAGITLLDGDHGLGKTLLAHQLAAAVSSGTPMPDGTPTIQGGVIIVTPFTDPSTTQLQLLTSLGADLSRIQILSFLPNQDPPPPQTSAFPPSKYRPFSLPNDLTHLFAAIERVDARLILFDPFIYLLSSQRRTTNRQLCHLLSDLNQFLLTHNIACLLVRNCRAKGGHAKPSALEQSDHFLTIAASRLLLAPDPMQPAHILLSHALNRHSPLTPTLACQIQPLPANPNLAHFTPQGTHTLQACHLLTQRPDTLHRRILAQQLLPILANSPTPVPAATLYTLFPNSSISQIQHTLKDLLLLGHIQRPTRGFYTTYPTTTQLNPTAATTPQLNSTAATTSQAIPDLNLTAATTPQLNVTAATTPLVTTKFNATAATTSLPTAQLNPTAATTPKLNTTVATITQLNPTAATTSQAISELNVTAATTSQAISELNVTAATTSQAISELNVTAATTSLPTTKLDPTAATTSSAPPKLNATAATTSQPTAKLNSTAATTATFAQPKPARPQKHLSKRNKPHGRPNQRKKKP